MDLCYVVRDDGHGNYRVEAGTRSSAEIQTSLGPVVSVRFLDSIEQYRIETVFSTRAQAIAFRLKLERNHG